MNKEYLAYKDKLDERLSTLVQEFLGVQHPLCDSMAYGVATPGKRIRGALTLVFCARLGVAEEQAIPFAVALELIHAYSLVHDDMPEMDNDDFRRGYPTCHKKYGADMALLAGDGILNLSVEYLLSQRGLYQAEPFLNALEVLYDASGAKGMLCGQVLDKQGEEKLLSLEELLELHRCKTGALLLAPIRIAEALAECKKESYVNYCKHIGLAFQIKDDILDVEGSAEVLGKETGKDHEENKSTFISILGLSKSKEYLENELDEAIKAGGEDEFLLWLARYIGAREK